jgi:transposase
VLLRHYLERGLSKAEIARELGVSRRTVYLWIAGGQLDRDLDNAAVQYTPRPAVVCKIDAFQPIIDTRLAEFPKLTATRLFDEIRAAGYVGGYTQVKEYVRRVRPAPVPDPVVRFETPPGHQAQVDFAEFRLPWGKRYALLVVLGFSRLMWLQFCTRQTMAVLMRGLEEAFAFFGGVPAELLFDR